MAEKITELRGKVRADLRNEQLRRLLEAWEKRRDELYDEISFKKGQAELLEEHIKFVYSSILSVNKEEGDKERERLAQKVKEVERAAVEEKVEAAEKERLSKEKEVKKPRKKKTPKKKVTKKN